MKRLMLILCFVFMLTGSAFADYGIPSGLPDPDSRFDWLDEYRYKALFRCDGGFYGDEYLLFYSREAIFYDNGFIHGVGIKENKNNVGFLRIDADPELHDDWSTGGSSDEFCVNSAYGPKYGSLVWASHDIVNKSNGSVFFSVISPVEKLPQMVVPQIAVIAGVGVLLISLMLLPNLLRRLWAFS